MPPVRASGGVAASVATLLLQLVVAAGCASTPSSGPATAPAPITAATTELSAAYSDYRTAGLDSRRFDPAQYWRLARRIFDRDPQRFRVRELGSSIEGRPLYRVDFGEGDTTVLLWSQMHGDESTASRALLDVFDYLQRNPDDARVRRIEERLAVTVVPVLNPDGAARFVRYNAVGIDINRDARRLASPEAQVLKAVRDQVGAQWGFNLHDQNIRTRRGRSDQGVQISLLAPPPGADITNDANQNAKNLAALLVYALRPVVGDAIARYSETFNPRAFGDLMTQWGTATVLIESGGSLDDPDKELPRRANFIAILSALDAIASGAWRDVSQDAYAALPPNGRAVSDLLIFGASIALPGREPVRADVTVIYADSLDRSDGVINEVGDLEGIDALRVIDATDLYLVPAVEPGAGREGP
ncbi:MAG: M14 family zinc carboxypeptidase, partial [Acidobacteriota bacterium]